MPIENKAGKIFASVGSRFTMDRLLHYLESILQRHPGLKATVQVGDSLFKSETLEITQWTSADEFQDQVQDCDILVSHAGMGNVLLAAKYKKPIVIVPRLFVLNEHVNDHQVGTAEALSDKNFVFIANNERELEEAIFDALACANNLSEEWASCSESAEPLIEVIKQFIDDA